MTSKNETMTFANRDLVAMVRAEIALAGRSDVTIERIWIDEDEPGHPFLLRVPVGTELVVPLQAMDGFFITRTDDDRKWHAREFAKALINLKSAEKTLEKYARDVRRAANAAIAAARADGLDILLAGVGFKPTYAHHLTGKSWKDAAFHVLAAVTIRHTSLHLRQTTSTFWVEEPADVGAELKEFLDEQCERQARIAEMEALGADLVVDAITLDLLEAHGLDTRLMLTQVWKAQCVNLTVQHLGRDAPLSISSSDGKVTASIVLEQAVWNGEHLWFVGDEQAKDHRSLVGKALGDLVPHPVFRSRPIVAVESRHVDHIVFDLSDKALFDADTGRIWREERLAA